MNKNQDLLEDNLDLSEILTILWRKKFLIFCFIVAFGSISTFYSLSLPNIYKSSAVLIGTSDSSSSSNVMNQYSGIAAMAGISLPSSVSKDKTKLALEVIKSKDFLKHILSFDLILENLMAVKDYDLVKKKLIYDTDIYNPDTRKWVKGNLGSKKLKPSYLDVHRVFISNLTILSDNTTGFTYISYNHLSPDFSKYFLDLIITELNNIIRDQDIYETNNAIEYLKIQLEKYPQSDIQKSINGLIKTQLETQMLAYISEDYVLSYIDKPFVPELKSSPNRTLIVIMGILMGLIIGSLVSLLQYTYYHNKK